MLFLAVMLLVGASSRAQISALPVTEAFDGTTSIFEGGEIINDAKAGNALKVSSTTATASFSPEYTLAKNETVTFQFTAFQGWTSGGLSTVTIKNSEGQDLVSYLFDNNACNVTDVAIGGETVEGFETFFGQSNSTNAASKGSANGFGHGSQPFVATEGYNPLVTMSISGSGLVEFNLQYTSAPSKDINVSYSGTLPEGTKVDLGSFVLQSNKDNAFGITNLSITTEKNGEEPVPAETVGTYTMTVLPTTMMGETTAKADIEVTVKKAGEKYWLESEADVFKGLTIPFAYNDATKMATFEQTFVTTTEDAAFVDSPNLYAAAFVFNGSVTEPQPSYPVAFDAETGFEFAEGAGLAWFACDNEGTPYNVYSAFYVVVPGSEDEEPSLAPGEYSATYAIQEGEKHVAGETVDVTVTANDLTEVVATLTFGFEGGAEFASVKKDDKRIEGFWGYCEGNGENGKENEGTVYIIRPKYNGTVEVGVVLNANKDFFITEDGTALEDYNALRVDAKYQGTYTFNVTGGKEYKVYCTGSKLGFYGFNYKFTVSEEEVIYGDASIEGEWNFTINDHYVGTDSRGEVTDTYTATLDGNTVTFTNAYGDDMNIVAEFTAENTLTFNMTVVVEPESAYNMAQNPFTDGSKVTDLGTNPEDFVFESFTATYDSEAGTLTFPEGAGLAYGRANAEGKFSYYDAAFDIVSAAKAKAEEVIYGDASIEGEWQVAINDHYVGASSRGEATDTYTATLNGNIVTFADQWDELPMVAEFTAENTLTFKQVAVGAPAQSTLTQIPFVAGPEGTVEEINPEDFTFQSFTATYDAKTGTITFPEGAGLVYGYVDASTTVSDYHSAFEFVSAKKAGGEEPQPEVTTRRWDFTNWSEATVANLKADAAQGVTEGWSDVEKNGDTEPSETSKDNCFWSVNTPDEIGGLSANKVLIDELKGLKFGANVNNRGMAIAVNYPVALSTYEGPSYLWLGGAEKKFFTIPAVKAGSTIKMGVESHKTTDARGVDLLVNGTSIGKFTPTVYAENTWTVTAEEAVDVVVDNTNGCHIYYIEVEQDQDALLALAKTDLATVITAVESIESFDNYTEESVAELAAALTAASNVADNATIAEITEATYALLNAKAALNEKPREELTEVTAAAFYKWDGDGAYAKPVETIAVESHYGETIGAGAMVLGTSTVDHLIYADLTGATKMVIEGTSGVALRILMNRQIDNNGPLVEKNVTIGEDGKAEVDLTDMRLPDSNEQMNFIHLVSIKTTWGMEGTGTVNKISVNTEIPEFISYTVNETADGHVVRTTKGLAKEGATVKVPYRKYNVQDGKLYQKGATNKEYNYSFTLATDGQEENIEYAATETEDVVFISEGEDIAGLTPITTGNAAIRSSNSAAGYAAEDTEIVTLEAGAYTVHVAMYDATKGGGEVFTFKAGTETFELTAGENFSEGEFELTLTETTAIVLAANTATDKGLDAIYVVKKGTATGINTINAEFENGAVYNLQGQKVMKAQKGLYIINGKKVVVK